MSVAVTSPKRKPSNMSWVLMSPKENPQNTDASFKVKTMLSLKHDLLSKGLT